MSTHEKQEQICNYYTDLPLFFNSLHIYRKSQSLSQTTDGSECLAAIKSKPYFAIKYRRIQKRRGHKKGYHRHSTHDDGLYLPYDFLKETFYPNGL